MIRIARPEAPAWDEREILRYARVREETPEITTLMRGCIAEAEPLLTYQVCYTIADVDREGERYRLCGIEIASATVARTLNGCDRALLFAATVGTPFDRLIAKYSKLSPSKAVMLHAIGAERVEALCDAFSDQIRQELFADLRPRVSPGYGDFPLELQRNIFAVLDCPRKIGLTLNDSLLMSPSKSVTALAGINSCAAGTSSDTCGTCDRINCAYREQR